MNVHSSLGIGLRLYEPLKCICIKTVGQYYPPIERRLILKISVTEMNNTINEKILVPLRSVFGILQRFPILKTNLQKQHENQDTMKKS